MNPGPVAASSQLPALASRPATAVAPLAPRAAAASVSAPVTVPPRSLPVSPPQPLGPGQRAFDPPPARRQLAPGATVGAQELHTPDWVKDAIFYQVFPERLRNGDTSNDPPGTVPWGSPPKNDNFFMGGDLQGVAQSLPHMAKLGVNALYLNPIFTSPSNHKYDTTDYSTVDPSLGGDAAFNDLVTKAHQGGMKIMLDGVLNHTSNEHVWFKDVREKGPASKYWSWYNVHKFPITTWRDSQGVLRSNDYESWGKPEWGGPYATLPVLQSTNPEVMNELVTGPNSLLRRWIRDGHVDGWRMDVADEVEPEVWQQARKVIKSEKSDAYMVGENWQDASAMLQGDQFDGATNYKYFQQPAVEFFAKKDISADQFVARLGNGYSREAKLAMLNPLESHDTPRFITQAGGDWYRVRPAAIFQMTYQGAPSILYGAEIGQEGGPDPDSRRAFDWDLAGRITPATDLTKPVAPDASREERAGHLFGLYQRLIETRKGSEALRRGDFQVLATHNANNTVAYRRFVQGDARDAVVALNNSPTPHPVEVPVAAFAPDGTSYTDAISGAKLLVRAGKLTLSSLDGNFGAVLLRDAAAPAVAA